MLIEFKVANYRSIRAEQTLSMVASNYSDELPQNLISCDHVPGLKGTKLVKAVALYGANASGKSNIVAALRFFAEFVRDSATELQPGASTGAQPFKLDPACLTEPSKFEITAVINGIRTLYGIEMTLERVTSEYLVAYPKGRSQVWFERDWDEKKGKYEWSKSTEHFKHDKTLHAKTRENAAFVSIASQFNHAESNSLRKWMENLARMMTQADDAVAAKSGLHINGIREILSSMSRIADLGIAELAPRELAKEESVTEMMRALFQDRKFLKNIATQGIQFPPANSLKLEGDADSKDRRKLIPEFRHRGKDSSVVSLDYREEESTGTQRYFELSAEVLFAHTFGYLLVVDEIEASLHPLLVVALIRRFLELEMENRGAQLIFTTHNPLLLDQTLLRRDQIWFTEKDQEGATRLYPLTDFKPRKDESLVKGYLAGRYGGIPFIPEGLKF